MQISVSSTLTLFHDGQFWVGVVERVEDGKLSAAHIVFDAEPSDEEVLQFVVRKWKSLRFHGNAETKAHRTQARRKAQDARFAQKQEKKKQKRKGH